jgi:hypothetical protein
LAFWKNNIDKCNDPAQRAPGQTLAACIEVQRIVTSAAFFLSIEFKQTGGLVREFYVAALDRPASNNMPTFVEFMRDAQGIQKGVVVGQGNWQQVLDANRTAFMNEFVTRAEFGGVVSDHGHADAICRQAVSACGGSAGDDPGTSGCDSGIWRGPDGG